MMGSRSSSPVDMANHLERAIEKIRQKASDDIAAARTAERQSRQRCSNKVKASAGFKSLSAVQKQTRTTEAWARIHASRLLARIDAESRIEAITNKEAQDIMELRRADAIKKISQMDSPDRRMTRSKSARIASLPKELPPVEGIIMKAVSKWEQRIAAHGDDAATPEDLAEFRANLREKDKPLVRQYLMATSVEERLAIDTQMLNDAVDPLIKQEDDGLEAIVESESEDEASGSDLGDFFVGWEPPEEEERAKGKSRQ